jgi:very-short-patch-repair endonuclease
MSTEEKIAALRSEYLASEAASFDDTLVRWCQSPIERLVLAKLLTVGWFAESQTEWTSAYETVNAVPNVKCTGRILHAPHDPAFVVVQLPVMEYVVDFAFFCCGERLVVELDGHDFHEKTRAQAAHDKRRDRRFVAAGWKVLRYTGSEVYADVDAVVNEVDEHLLQAVDRERLERAGVTP